MDTSKQKPNLMSSNRVAADGGKRILAHLEHGPKAASKPPLTSGWNIDGWGIGLGLLVVTICTVAWLVHDDTLTPGSFGRSRSSVRTHFERRPIEAAEPQVAANPPAEQAAAIVNEPIARTSSTQTQEAHPSSVAAPAAPTLARSEAPRAASTTHRQAGAASTAAAPVARLQAARPAVAASTSASGDTDVALLTALVAHSSKSTAVRPERNRDVVERQEGDSTAQLLARCKQLGLIEGMLCRSRICSGRWDADPACNAPSH